MSPHAAARLRVYGRGSRALALAGVYLSPSMAGSRARAARAIREGNR
jgi:hypothetical protein